MLKSCELTGIWEKKLRDIEHGKYDAALFVNELKIQSTNIVNEVLADNNNRRLTILSDDDLKKKRNKGTEKKNTTKNKKDKSITTEIPANDSIIGMACPVCGIGHVIKGKTAYGCDRWREGCSFRLNFKK